MYAQKISRANPGLIILVLDDSGSMGDSLPGTTDAAYKWVERYTGLIFRELLARSTEMGSNERAVVKPRYFVKAVVYGSQLKLWPDEGTDPANIEQAITAYGLAQNSLGLQGAMGGTDALSAFQQAREILTAALAGEQFRKSFPPMVFHLTDGASATDASPVAQAIAQLATDDGNTLVVNAFIGTRTKLTYKGPEDFPGYTSEEEAGPDGDSVRLFTMSSPVPDTVRQNLIDDGIFPQLREGSRLYFDVRTKDMLKHVLQTVGSVGSRATKR